MNPFRDLEGKMFRNQMLSLRIKTCPRSRARILLGIIILFLGWNTTCQKNRLPWYGKGWAGFETEQFVFRFHAKLLTPDRRAAAYRLDTEFQHAVDLLQMELEEKIVYVVAESPEECGSFIDMGPINAYAVPAENRIVSVTWDNLHEAVHVLDFRHAKISHGHLVISEGLAVALGGNTRTAPGVALMESRHRLEASTLTELKDLFSMSRDDFLRQRYFTYFESGAFVGFVLERFGGSKLKDFSMRINQGEELDSAVDHAFGLPLSEIEAMWKTDLGRIQVHDMDFQMPKGGKLIMQMRDPMGDHTGDGDYTIPNDRFTPGSFDLTEFEVTRKGDEVYFRLRFQDTAEPVMYREGEEKFVPGAVIAIGKGDAAGSARNMWHGVAFEGSQGFHTAINVGVSVSVCNATGRVVYTTSEVYDRMVNHELRTVTFSLPIEVIGEPRAEWTYFVGVGLMSDRTMSFLYAGPMPVRKAHRAFIQGGNFEIGNPAFIDVLLPSDIDQPSLLNEYLPEEGILPVIPMIRSTESSLQF